MDTSAPIHTTPETYIEIENCIFDKYLRRIGVYGFAVYSVIKRHLNPNTHQCNTSFAAIARTLGIDQARVIRSVHTLRSLNLISPRLAFQEDGEGQAAQQEKETSP